MACCRQQGITLTIVDLKLMVFYGIHLRAISHEMRMDTGVQQPDTSSVAWVCVCVRHYHPTTCIYVDKGVPVLSAGSQ